jgi:hypothetical protein
MAQCAPVLGTPAIAARRPGNPGAGRFVQHLKLMNFQNAHCRGKAPRAKLFAHCRATEAP